MKRVVSLILTLVLLVGMIPDRAWAAVTYLSYYGSGQAKGQGKGSVGTIEATFAVYLTDDEFKTPLAIADNLTDTQILDALNTSISKEYDTHYPYGYAGGLPLFLAAPWTSTGQNIISKGQMINPNVSNQDLQYVPRAASTNYISKLGSSALSTPVHSALYNNAKAAYTAGGQTLTEFENNWRKQITPATFSYASAQNVMSYMVGSNTPNKEFALKTRLDTFLKSTSSDPKQKEAEEYAAYFELIMSVYVMAQNVMGSNKDLASKYAVRIDQRYGANRLAQNLEKKPLLVAFEAVYGFNSADKKAFYFGSTVDMASWAAGGDQEKNLRRNPGSSANTLSMIKSVQSANLAKNKRNSMAYLPNISTKYSGLRDNAIQALTGFRFSNSGTTVSSEHSVGFMQMINLKPGYNGLSIAISKFILPQTPPGRGAQDIEITPLKQEVFSDIIGEATPIDFKVLPQGAVEMEMWSSAAAKNPTATYKVKLGITQTAGPTVAITPSGGAPALNAEVTLTWAQFSALLNGTGYRYSAETSTIPISAGESKVFKFQSTLQVQASYDVEKKWIQFLPNDGLAQKTYYRLEESINYTSSSTNTFGQIKSNYPEQEQWEAMAGHPSTERLYYTVGGHEFLVDVELEYVEDATSTRTYTMKYNQVPSGFTMPSERKDLGNHSSAPSAPAPKRTPTDCVGASTTVAWTVHQGSVTATKTVGTGENAREVPVEWNYYATNPGYSKSVGGWSRTWTQTVNYDYMKIKQAVVYRIDNGKLILDSANVDTLGGGKSSITATIQKGTPTVFGNIDRSNTAKGGRLVYSLETAQGDNVVWNMGNSDNEDNNSETTGTVKEFDAFTAYAKKTTQVDVVSDVLILQTSSGDQSVIYFSKKSPTSIIGTADGRNGVGILVEKSSKEAMWDNNSNSAAKWKPDDINIGSYNGKYSNPSSAFRGSGSGRTVSTVLDNSPFITRPSRPSDSLILAGTWYPEKLTPNGEYNTSDDSNAQSHTLVYSRVFEKDYKANRIDSDFSGEAAATRTFVSEYYKGHGDVNNVVIHDPVSAQNALILPLDNARDQRMDGKNIYGGDGLVEDQVITKKILNPEWRSNLLFNPGAEFSKSLSNQPLGWETWIKSGGITFSRGTAKRSGSASYALKGTSGTYLGIFYQDVDIEPGDTYRLTGYARAGSAKAFFHIYPVDSSGNEMSALYLSSEIQSDTYTKVSTDVKAPAGAVKLRVKLGITGSVANGWADFDDLEVNNMSRLGFIPNTNIIKDVQKELNPEYLEYIKNPDAYKGGTTNYSFTGGVQTFTAPTTGVYSLEVWGAQGGGSGGRGGYSKGSVALTAGEALTIMVGGQGETGYKSGGLIGGWNGGGNATSLSTDGNNGSGGGGTDIRKGGTSLSNRILVAGGGGGGVDPVTTLGDAGGLTGITGNFKSGTQTAAGGTQASNGAGATAITGTGVSSTRAGGGGGYYGGDAKTYIGGGGSGYIGGVVSGETRAGNMTIKRPNGTEGVGNTGNGYARIVSPSNTIPKQYLEVGEVVEPEDDFAKVFQLAAGPQSFSAPAEGKYLVEAWGAQGGTFNSNVGGKGGYARAFLSLKAGDLLNILVGGKGGTTGFGGFNGGGASSATGASGGGASSVGPPAAEMYIPKIWGFTGTDQQVTLPAGTYVFELFGAGFRSAGGYTYGEIYLDGSTPVKLKVGGSARDRLGAWPDGGTGGKGYSSSNYDTYDGEGGSGGTFVYVGDQVMLVAGGAGGSGEGRGGKGGGLSGEAGQDARSGYDELGGAPGTPTSNNDRGGTKSNGKYSDGSGGGGGGYTYGAGGKFKSGSSGSSGGGGGGSGFVHPTVANARTVLGGGNTSDGEIRMYLKGTSTAVNYVKPSNPTDFVLTKTTQKVKLSPGTYRFEVWGAAGYGNDTGRGGYAVAEKTFTSETEVSITVGGAGARGDYKSDGVTGAGLGGFNGGGMGGNGHKDSRGGPGGGGATDISIGGVVVLAAGGGGGGHGGGAGGGLAGGDPSGDNFGVKGGAAWTNTTRFPTGIAQGLQGTGAKKDYTGEGGGGGGVSGGGGGRTNANEWQGGGGGSGYVHPEYAGLTLGGSQMIPNPDGGLMKGKTGDGYARISKVATQTYIVAGGGGGAGSGGAGGAGGGTAGLPSGLGGTQTAGNAQGIGGSATTGGAGGGGYFGGRAATNTTGGGGGSGFLSSGLQGGATTAGNASMPNAAKGTQVGNSGDGLVKVSIPSTTKGKTSTGVLVDAAYQPEKEPPEEAYKIVTETIKGDRAIDIPGQGSFKPGNFINLDYAFEVYYPNTGDFDEGEQWGIRRTSEIPGKGFVDNLDTTKWISKKVVLLDFNVIYRDQMYLAGEEIILFDQDRDSGVDIGKANGYKYPMYCVEGNLEARNSRIEFYSIAINSPYGVVDSDYEINNIRYSNLAAEHSAYKESYIDLVGRIGNMSIMDTTDWRFSNLFKQPTAEISPYTGLPEVNTANQKAYVGSITTALGHVADDGTTRVPESTTGKFTNTWLEKSRTQFTLNPTTKLKDLVYMTFDRWTSVFELKGKTNMIDTKFLNTYGGVDYKEAKPLAFPLTAAYNSGALSTQPMRLGYHSFMDIDTVGTYSEGFVQVVPYYYKLNLDRAAPSRIEGETSDSYLQRAISSGYIVPVDIYMSVNGSYKNINKYNVVSSAWDPDEEALPEDMRFYPNTVSYNWNNEKSRRQVSVEEEKLTERLAETVYPEGYAEETGEPVPNQYPAGDYTSFGNNQYLKLMGRNRTSVGSTKTYGADKNPGDRLSPDLYSWQGQRWHFSMGLPSSAVILDVKENGTKHQLPSTSSFEESRKGNWILLCALDVQAVGSMWVLQNDNANTSVDVTVRNPTGTTSTRSYDIACIPQKVVQVMSSDKSSLEDMATAGTH